MNSNHRVKPGKHIRKCHAHLHRLAIGFTRDRHHPRHALNHKIITGALRVRPVLAKAGDRAINQARRNGFQAFIIQAIFGQTAHLEIFNHHITFKRKLADQLLPFWFCQINANRLLAAIGRLKIGGITRTAITIGNERWPPTACIIAFTGFFNFNDLGTKISKHLCGPRPRQNASEIKNAKSAEWACQCNSPDSWKTVKSVIAQP